jgi:hypothetical protein
MHSIENLKLRPRNGTYVLSEYYNKLFEYTNSLNISMRAPKENFDLNLKVFEAYVFN